MYFLKMYFRKIYLKWKFGYLLELYFSNIFLVYFKLYAQNYHCSNALKAYFKNTYPEVVIDFKLNLSVIFKFNLFMLEIHFITFRKCKNVWHIIILHWLTQQEELTRKLYFLKHLKSFILFIFSFFFFSTLVGDLLVLTHPPSSLFHFNFI